MPSPTPDEAPALVGASVRWHAMVYVLIGGMLLAINLATTPATLWSLWALGPWFVGLSFHALGSRALIRSQADRRQQTTARRARRDQRDQHGVGPVPGDDEHTWVRNPDADPSDAPTAWDSAPAAGSGSDARADTLEHATDVHVPAEEARLRPSQRLADRFVIERPLGRGGMGEVFVAHDEVLDEDVAVKTISSTIVGQQATARFLREAQAARKVTHPNVVRIHDIGQDGPISFISMELVRGQTLGQRIREELQLELAELKDIALQICAGLQAAHEVGVVHRDLKPDNVLIDAEGRARIIDFGLAKLATADGLTATGAVMGTPEYMAPEQMRGEACDARTDVYAMGCILYHGIAGVPPFSRDSAVAIGVAHLQDTPPPLRDYRPDVPDAWVDVVLRALEKAPDDRYPDVAGLQAALEGL